jgi:regulator of sirC expression with transglutaminase-like and TPR domain
MRADALVYRASSRRQLGDLVRARQDIDAALKLAPEDAGGLLERGNVRRLQGDAAGAREDWGAVARLAPKTPAARAAQDNLAALDKPQ